MTRAGWRSSDEAIAQPAIVIRLPDGAEWLRVDMTGEQYVTRETTWATVYRVLARHAASPGRYRVGAYDTGGRPVIEGHLLWHGDHPGALL